LSYPGNPAIFPFLKGTRGFPSPSHGGFGFIWRSIIDIIKIKYPAKYTLSRIIVYGLGRKKDSDKSGSSESGSRKREGLMALTAVSVQVRREK
jgi:hypothetical protein